MKRAPDDAAIRLPPAWALRSEPITQHTYRAADVLRWSVRLRRANDSRKLTPGTLMRLNAAPPSAAARLAADEGASQVVSLSQCSIRLGGVLQDIRRRGYLVMLERSTA